MIDLSAKAAYNWSPINIFKHSFIFLTTLRPIELNFHLKIANDKLAKKYSWI